MLALALLTASARAQGGDGLLMRAFDLEQRGLHREAASAYRRLIGGTNTGPAVLGLERAYAELGWSDSLLVVMDSLVRARPADPLFRAIVMRTHRMAGRPDAVRATFESWVKAAPHDAAPFREFARMLIQEGRTAAADSVLQRARREIGDAPELDTEVAQLRAATGQWSQSAVAWRAAVDRAPFMEQAAVFALLPAPPPARGAIRESLLAPPVVAGARRVLAGLEVGWGSPRAGWEALREVRVDSATVSAWLGFAERAEHAEAWTVARDALSAVYALTPRTDLATRAARAALLAGDASGALSLTDRAMQSRDSAATARIVLPVRVRALAFAGRSAEAERVVRAYTRFLRVEERRELSRAVAFGWVRAGDVARARLALGGIGAPADSDAVAGWLALYEGDLGAARRALRGGGDESPGALAALALLGRTRSERAPAVGAAFLALARGDSARAAGEFERAADSLPEAAPLLLAIAAQIHTARRDDERAVVLWQAIVERFATAPEAAEADLEWARALVRRGDAGGAAARLEHLILTYPRSALVPQARRELEVVRGGIPRTS